MQQELSIITSTYDFMKYIVPIASRFPKNHRYQIGERIENLVFDILELLIDAKFSRDKSNILISANIKLEKLRFFIRLVYDLKLIPIKRYGYISEQINNIGSQLGGWIKKQSRQR